MSSLQPETLHVYLKASSMARHQSTESTMGNVGFSTKDGYIGFLRVSATGVDALQRAIAPYQADFDHVKIQFALRLKAAIADLAALGATWEPMSPPVIPSFDHALGAAYTLEGSRLGNAMLARQLAKDNPELATLASSFLSYPTTPGFWRDFTDKLNIVGADRTRWPDILAGSLIGFDTFQKSAENELAHQ